MPEEGLRRRDVLRASVAAATVAAVGASGRVGASTTASGGASTIASGSASATASDDASSSASAAYAPHGELDIDAAAEAVVTSDGTTAFVAVGTGFASVDVSDPANPKVLAERRGLSTEDETVREVLDVKYDDDRLLVPTAAQGGGPRGFYVFDVSDPANPQQFGEWFATPEHGNHNAFLLDGVAYLTGGLVVDVVDVAEPPFERLSAWKPSDWNADWSGLPNTVLHDLYVQGDYAYCAYWDAGTFVLDVSDPANPSFVSRVGEYTLDEIMELDQQAYLEPPGNDHYVTVNDDASLLAVGGESWDVDTEDDSGGPSGIRFYDITNAASPERVGSVDAPVSRRNTYRGGTWTTAHNFDLRGERLYASWYQGGVTLHDVSDPANPERLAWWAEPAERAFWTAQLAVEGEFFVASSYQTNGATPGLLTFPDEAGEMATLPDAVAWSEDDISKTTTTAATGETTSTPTTTTATTTTAAPTEETTTATSTAAEDATPGFGPIAALGGLALGAARYLRGEDAN